MVGAEAGAIAADVREEAGFEITGPARDPHKRLPSETGAGDTDVGPDPNLEGPFRSGTPHDTRSGSLATPLIRPSPGAQ